MSFLLMFCGNLVCFLLGCFYSDWRREKIDLQKIKGKCEYYKPTTNTARISSMPNGECEYYKPMTNADRIRSMSDEELALWINDITTNALSVLALGSDKQTKSIFHWLDWLKEEVKRIE